jgi:hypothetical protein
MSAEVERAGLSRKLTNYCPTMRLRLPAVQAGRRSEVSSPGGSHAGPMSGLFIGHPQLHFQMPSLFLLGQRHAVGDDTSLE